MAALQDLLRRADFYKKKISAFELPKKEEQKSLDDEYEAIRFGAAYDFMLESSIPLALREDYAIALSVSRQQKDMDPFSKLIAQCVILSEQDYCQSL